MPKIDLDSLVDDLENGVVQYNEYFAVTATAATIAGFSLPIASTMLKVGARSLPMSLLLPSVLPFAIIAGALATKFGPDLYKVFKSKLFNKDTRKDLLCTDNEKVNRIVQATVSRLEARGIVLSSEYIDLLTKMAQIMANNVPLKFPTVLTARPGLGKTEMLICTLADRITNEQNFTAIVVIRFISEAKRIAEEVNRITGKDECFIRPTFQLLTMDDEKCPAGYKRDKYKSNLCYICKENTCPVKKRQYSHKMKRVVIVTTQFFLICVRYKDYFNSLREYKPFKGAETVVRNHLFIDEHPGLVPTLHITDRMMNECISHTKKEEFAPALIEEIITAKEKIGRLMGGKEEFEYINDDLKTSFRLSRKFIDGWFKNPHQNNLYEQFPNWVNEVLENGGIRMTPNNFMDFKIAVGRYLSIPNNNIRTIILDGTGVKDLVYREDNFNILNVKEIRDFSNVTIHQYDFTLSKNKFNDEKAGMYKIITNELIKKANGKSSLVVTYMGKVENEITKLLYAHGNFKVEHYGNLIGRNDFNDCVNVFFIGLNNYQFLDYLINSHLIAGKQLNLKAPSKVVNRFEDEFVQSYYLKTRALSLYQDLMRCKIRFIDNTDDINVFIYSYENNLIKELQTWLPGSKLVQENIPVALKRLYPKAQKLTKALIRKVMLFKPQLPKDYKQVSKHIKELAVFLGRIPNFDVLEVAFGEKVQKSKSGRYKDYARKGLIEDFIDKHDKMPDKIEMSELFEEKVNDKKYEKYKTISTKYLGKKKTPTKK